MGAFDLLRIASSGLSLHQTWLDALGHNIANINTYTATSGPAFQADLVVAESRTEGGVKVAGIEKSDPEGTLLYAPDHPLADEQGYVRAPAEDLGDQMTQLVMAQRGFQANAQVTKFAQDTYTAAVGIGR